MPDKNKISEIMEATLAKLRELGRTETIIGEPFVAGDVTVVPVSKLSCGFGSGGSDYNTRHSTNTVLFGGGGGAGIDVTPVSFIVIRGDKVDILPASGTVATPVPMADITATIDKAVDALPGIVEKLEAFLTKQKEKKAAKAAEAEPDNEIAVEKPQ